MGNIGYFYIIQYNHGGTYSIFLVYRYGDFPSGGGSYFNVSLCIFKLINARVRLCL